MKPVIALIGRPNVGKSTLFNQLTQTRNALVANLPGLTRDRQYGDGKYENKSFIVIDTGGLGESDEGVEAYMAEQARSAIEEADIVLFVVDARAGLLGSDQMIADHLRKHNKKAFLVVNKIDGLHDDSAMAEFHCLGFPRMYATAASHGRGVLQLVTEILLPYPEDPEELPHEETGIKIAIVGRPNVGKSTLVNRMLGEDRVIVFDMPGTTRDSIYIPYERQGKKYTLIDTAGVRRRGRVQETVEKFSVIKTLQAIKDAHVVVIVFDAREGIVDQDLHMLGFALESGRAVVVAINKWDNMDEYDRKQVKTAIDLRLDFIPYVKIHLISALHGTGVGDLYPSIQRAFDSAMLKTPTNRLTQILQDAVEGHQPPLVHGRRIKLRYAHMGGQNPPIIVIHGNQTESVSKDYRRYLENIFRKVLKLQGTPIQLEFKTSDNPYKEEKKVVRPAQLEKLKRFVPTNQKRDNDKKKQR